MSSGEDKAGKLLVGFHGEEYRTALKERVEAVLNWMTGGAGFTALYTRGRG